MAKYIITTSAIDTPKEPPITGAVLEEVHDDFYGTATKWVAEVPDIVELAHKVKHGLIVFPKSELEDYDELEIYNDYRE